MYPDLECIIHWIFIVVLDAIENWIAWTLFQDEFGNSEYGYSNVNSQKHEVGNGYTGVSGSYQYVDPAGKLQTVNYVADALGFRVADSRLPVHDAALPVAPVFDGVAPEPVVYDGVAPEPVVDTPEVAAAKAEFLKTFEEVASRYLALISKWQVCDSILRKLKKIFFSDKSVNLTLLWSTAITAPTFCTPDSVL